MADEDEFQEVAGAARSVAETNRLFRLSQVTGDPAQISRSIAIIAADTEDDARAIAAKADPMGRDWNDRRLFEANYQRYARKTRHWRYRFQVYSLSSRSEI